MLEKSIPNMRNEQLLSILTVATTVSNVISISDYFYRAFTDKKFI